MTNRSLRLVQLTTQAATHFRRCDQALLLAPRQCEARGVEVTLALLNVVGESCKLLGLEDALDRFSRLLVVANILAELRNTFDQALAFGSLRFHLNHGVTRNRSGAGGRR